MNPTYKDYNPADVATRVPGQEQFVSYMKWATKTIAANTVWPSNIDFFTAAPSNDPTVDNYAAGNQLTTSGVSFTIQAIGLHIKSDTLADMDALINRGVLILITNHKEIGRYLISRLHECGGLYLATSTAGSYLGAMNGMPDNSPFCIAPQYIEPNQTVKAQILGPTDDPYTIVEKTTMKLFFEGFEGRPVI
jgi:hypothetical protein